MRRGRGKRGERGGKREKGWREGIGERDGMEGGKKGIRREGIVMSVSIEEKWNVVWLIFLTVLIFIYF